MSKDGPPPTCAACGIAFSRPRNLKDHLRLASLEERHDKFYSLECHAKRLKEVHDIDWAEICQQDLVLRSKSHRQPASRGRSATRSHRSPSDEDDVPLADRREKLSATAAKMKRSPRPGRISPLVVASTSSQQNKRRRREDSEERDVYGRAAIERIERFAETFVQNANCRDLAHATYTWKQSSSA